MTDSLDEKNKQIINSIKNEFNVFYAKNTSDSDNLTEVFWDENQDSKYFFDIAKKEGIKTIIAEGKILDKDLTQMDSEDEESLNPETLKLLKTELSGFSKYVGKVGYYKFSWTKDGTKYSLMEVTEWYQLLGNVVKQLSTVASRQASFESRFEDEVIPEELKKKSEEELGEEMIDFIKEQLPTLDNREFYQVKELFWSKKGIMRFTSNPEIRFKMSKVEMIARRRLEEAQAEDEKDKLPDLIDACVDWCKEHGLKKVIKANVKAFLAEKETTLSRNGEDMLYQRVNFKLKELDD